MFKKKKKVDKEPFFVVVGGGFWVADLWSQTSLTKKKKKFKIGREKKVGQETEPIFIMTSRNTHTPAQIFWSSYLQYICILSCFIISFDIWICKCHYKKTKQSTEWLNWKCLPYEQEP